MRVHEARPPSAAVAAIQSGQRVFVHGAAATPLALLRALVKDAGRLRDVELIHLHTAGDAAHADPAHAKSFRVTNLFVGANMRKKLDGVMDAARRMVETGTHRAVVVDEAGQLVGIVTPMDVLKALVQGRLGDIV